MNVERGTGGNYGDCTGFTADSTIYTGTLSSLPTNLANGVGNWTPAASPASRTQRVAVTVAFDYNAASKTATGTFTWEAQT